MKKNIAKPSHHQESKGEVRIIAGRWRGRKLPVLNAQGLRPTGDRIKETLFNWLMQDIVQANCLDCFAGSGSLGLEALSRQAQSVVFLEKDKNVVQQLTRNVQTLQCAHQAQIIHTDSLAFLSNPNTGAKFDLVFLDPPFHFNLAQQALDLLQQGNWLKPEALIYIETEREASLQLPSYWQTLKQKSSGMVNYGLYQYQD